MYQGGREETTRKDNEGKRKGRKEWKKVSKEGDHLSLSVKDNSLGRGEER